MRGRLHVAVIAMSVVILIMALIRARERQLAEEARLGERADDYALTARRTFDAAAREARTLLQSVDLALEETEGPAAYSRVLEQLMRTTVTPYSNVFALDADGVVLGAARRAPDASTQVASDCLEQVRRTRKFAVCGPARRDDARGARWEYVYLQPCMPGGTFAGFVAASIPMDSLEAVRLAQVLPKGSVLTMFDSVGTVMLRTLASDQWMGKRYPQYKVEDRSLLPAGMDTVILSAIDDQRRLFGLADALEAPWRIYVGIPVDSAFGPSRTQFIQDLLFGIALSVLVLFLGYWASARMVLPIESLTVDARAISEGDMSRRSAIDSDDEVGALARTFNEMADAISERNAQLASSQEQLRQSQKLEALGAFAGGIAHEFNNYLSSILGHAELALLESDHPERARPEVTGVIASAKRAAELTRRVMVFSRRQVTDARCIDVAHTVSSISRLLERLLSESITFDCAIAPSLGPVLIDPGQLEQVLMNLAVNARDAMPNGGCLTMIVDRATERDRARLQLADQPFVRITVQDTGPGVPPELRSHIFEPFFTTKDREHGTGLGLAISYGILQSVGGTIELDPSTIGGATFRLYLPEQPLDSARTPISTPVVTPSGGCETLLLVEDDTSVAEVARRLLTRAGYAVTVAPDAQRALVLLEQQQYDLLLSDIVMPGMSGAALALEATRLYGPLRVLLMSGYPDDDLAAHEIAQQRVAFLAKPFTQASLLGAVRAVLDGAART